MKRYLIEYGNSHYINPNQILMKSKFFVKLKLKKLIKKYRFVYVFELEKNAPMAYMIYSYIEGEKGEWKD